MPLSLTSAQTMRSGPGGPTPFGVALRATLFVSFHGGGRRAVPTIGRIVGRAAKRSGISKAVTLRTFRYSMATHILRHHVVLFHIQAILGHATITSTELCTHVSLEDLKEVVRRAHPHGRKDR